MRQVDLSLVIISCSTHGVHGLELRQHLRSKLNGLHRSKAAKKNKCPTPPSSHSAPSLPPSPAGRGWGWGSARDARVGVAWVLQRFGVTRAGGWAGGCALSIAGTLGFASLPHPNPSPPGRGFWAFVLACRAWQMRVLDFLSPTHSTPSLPPSPAGRGRGWGSARDARVGVAWVLQRFGVTRAGGWAGGGALSIAGTLGFASLPLPQPLPAGEGS